MKKKKNKPIEEEVNIIPEAKPEVKKQSFKVLKDFPTSDKDYKVGDTFQHNDKRVINFLKTNKII